jgi:hypothetical protein
MRDIGAIAATGTPAIVHEGVAMLMREEVDMVIAGVTAVMHTAADIAVTRMRTEAAIVDTGADTAVIARHSPQEFTGLRTPEFNHEKACCR